MASFPRDDNRVPIIGGSNSSTGIAQAATIDNTSGGLNINIAGGSLTIDSVSATGSAVPAKADYGGINVAGTLRGATGVNPSGSIYAQQVDLASIAGTTTATGNGVVSAGVQRVAIASDNTAFTVNAAQSGTWNIGTVTTVTGVTTVTTVTTVATVTNLAQMNGAAITMGNGASGTGVQRVTIASDSTGTVAATQSGTWNVGTVTTITTVSAARIVGNGGAVLDAVNTAATAPANGLLTLGIYNSTEPSPTTGQSVGIQLDSKGRQRQVIMDAAGNTRGANVDANNNLGVVLAAETTKVLGVTRTADGAGNLLTSNSTTYTAKFGLDSNLLGTLGTAFSTAGKVDVKGADGDVFVRQATASNLNATVVQATGTNLHTVLDSGTLTTLTTLTGTTTLTPGTGATNLGKAEDGVHTTGDVGVFALGVANEAQTALAADGDYIALATDTAGNTLVVGNIAHDGVDAKAPVKIGGYAKATAPTNVSADADRVNAWFLLNGAQATVLTAAGALIGGDASNGLDVDVTRMSALVAGAAEIGFVKVASGSIASGAIASGAVASGAFASGSIGSGAIASGAIASGAIAAGAIAAGATAIAENEDVASADGDRMVKVGQIRQDTPVANAGVSTDGDYLNFRADNFGKTWVTGTVPEDVAHVAGEALTVGGQRRIDTLATSAGTSGDWATANQSAEGGAWTTLAGTATPNGLLVGNFTSGDTYTALTNSAQAIKASAGNMYGYYIYNPNAAATYVFVYNIAAGSVTVGTSTPTLVFCIPATGGANLMFPVPIPFSNAGWSIAAATTGGGNTAPATALEAMVFYM